MRIHDAGEAARRPGGPVERDDRADAGAAGRQEAGPARMIAVAVEEEEEEEEEEAKEVHPVREQPEAGTDANTDTERLIASLPLFTMASALAALPKNSPDYAICLSPFDASAELWLLPACRHAFHAACIDVWLRTNPVCPICRSAVSSPPLPPLPVAATATAAGDQDQEPLGTRANSRSRKSFRVELDSVSNRRSSAAGGVKRRCTYSHGGFFDYHVDEKVEAIVSRVVRPMAARPRTAAAAAPGEALAEAVGSRGWLGKYLDRVAALATSLSQRLSLDRRPDDDSTRWDPEAAAVAKSTSASLSGRWSQGNRRDEPWDTDAPCRAEGGEEEPAPVALGRWIFGL